MNGKWVDIGSPRSAPCGLAAGWISLVRHVLLCAILGMCIFGGCSCDSQFVRETKFDYLCRGAFGGWTLKEKLQGKTDEKQRLISYCWLREGVTYDACERLQTVGTLESVPFLIFALRKIMPDEAQLRIRFPGWRGASPPTEPCVLALQKITGQEFVFWEDWESWWIGQNHSPVPTTAAKLYP